MKIIYMGTPDFAVPTLKTLLASKHEVVAVVTQPDKPKGRSGKLQMPPVKECALEAGLPVLQPRRVREPGVYEELAAFAPDVMVVAAFGQIIPENILRLPKYGCINVHASLLPKYRGAAPIQWSILNGDEKTGITIMQMDVGLDTGEILLQKEIELTGKETGGSLFDELSLLGGDLVLETLDGLENGTIHPIKQDEEKATHVSMLSKEDGNLNWNRSAKELEQYIRGLNPWPGAYSFWNGKMLKLWSALPVTKEELLSLKNAPLKEEDLNAEPGTAIVPDRSTLFITTGCGFLHVLEVQLEGKKRMQTADFLRGNAMETGCVLHSGKEKTCI